MRVDVAIVGGGPAGCSAALALRALGCSVAVVDKISRRGRPTETAHPGLAHLLASIDAESALEACTPCCAISSNWGRATAELSPSIMNPHGHAWFVDRATFDDHLKRLTREAGVEWVEGRATSVEFSESEEVTVQCSDYSSIRARWLFVATGATSWTSRIPARAIPTTDALVALWARADKPLETRALHLEATDVGWWYACPTRDNGSIIALVTDAENVRALGLHRPDQWNEQLASTSLAPLKRKRSISRPHALQIEVGTRSDSSGDRWTAIGDAVLRLDPLGSAGLATALDSGRRAAFAVSTLLSGEPIGLTAYHLWVSNVWTAFFQQRGDQYRVEAHKRRSNFWRRRLEHLGD